MTVPMCGIEWATSSRAETMRVLVCDDHSLFREGLRLLLQRLDDSIDVAIAGSCEKGVQEAAHTKSLKETMAAIVFEMV